MPRASGAIRSGGIVAGDAADIMQRIEEFVAAGASKFVLWPIGEATTGTSSTRRGG